jgi:hypothetical protein
MWHARDRAKIDTKLWSIHLKKKGHLEDLGIDGRIILKWTSNKQYGMAWTGFI